MKEREGEKRHPKSGEGAERKTASKKGEGRGEKRAPKREREG